MVDGEVLGLNDGRLVGENVAAPVVVVVVEVIGAKLGFFVGALVLPPVPIGLRVGANVPSFTLEGLEVGAIVLGTLHDPLAS